MTRVTLTQRCRVAGLAVVAWTVLGLPVALAAAYDPGPPIPAQVATAARAGAITIPTPSQSYGAVVASVLVPTPVYSEPDAGHELGMLGTTTALTAEPEIAMVLGARPDAQGTPWIEVQLPSRPDLSTGWIYAGAVTVLRDAWFVSVDLAARQVSVYDDGQLVQSAPAVVGTPATPTPTGLYSIYEIVPQAPASGFLGPYTVQLTAFSNVLLHFEDGDGRVAIHGRGGASLQVPLGSAASHGCVRVDNDVIEWIAGHVPLGTPVDIT